MQKKRTQAQPKKGEKINKKADAKVVKNDQTVASNSNLMALIIMFIDPER